MRNQCQLIAYPDCIGTNLKDLTQAVASYFGGAIGGIHLLPFYPSSADRGFAPITYTKVAPEFGSWADIDALSRDYELVVDFMYNHISRQSIFFQDFLALGDRSEYAGMFIRNSRFWPNGAPSDRDLSLIYTRKPRAPYLEVIVDGEPENVWCTFDAEQIDLNLESESARRFVKETLLFLCGHGVKMIRLDAFAYATKRPGTSCFFLEPDVWELLEFARQVTGKHNVELLPEVHEHYTFQQNIASHGYYVYDFALPFLFLHGYYLRTAKNIKNWLSICPHRQITSLDTHDGIGVVDVRDLISEGEIEKTRDLIFEHGANANRIYSTAEYNNLDIYQINCTYYSALGEDDTAYLMARAVQFFTPGIPQVYYVGLLAGKNDIAGVEKSRVGRDINRHRYSVDEVATEVERPVVVKLFALMRLRNTHPGFAGSYEVHTSTDSVLSITWTNGDDSIHLLADFARRRFSIDENTGGDTGMLLEEF